MKSFVKNNDMAETQIVNFHLDIHKIFIDFFKIQT
jgi:hypothetical protein